MSITNTQPRLEALIEACQNMDRRLAVRLLAEDIELRAQTGDIWEKVSQYAAYLGEHSLSIEAARRYAATRPDDIDHVFFYAMTLSRNNRIQEALKQLEHLPLRDQMHPAVLHFRGHIATQLGEFSSAENYFRKAIAISPAPVQWLALSVAKKFSLGDTDLADMEAVLPRIGRAPPDVRAQLYYALGKAYDDCGDIEKATHAYASGAVLMKQISQRPDKGVWLNYVKNLISGYSFNNLRTLKPSHVDYKPLYFVTGYPRSGTTLVEQILTSHSAIGIGAELNLVPAAFMPVGNSPRNQHISPIDRTGMTGEYRMEDAWAYERRTASEDPWGDIGRDYIQMLVNRFGDQMHPIDKTLNLGSFMGLLLHSLPSARIFWVRRRPEDCALSNYRLYSQPGTLSWSYAAEDIAEFFKAGDLLYTHWTQMFPDQIMTIEYENLVSEPEVWIRRMLDFAGLKEEQQVFEPHKSTRAVSTASMAQVRSPISKARIGVAESYKTFVEEFRRAYYG